MNEPFDTADRNAILAGVREAMRVPTNPHVRHGPAIPDRATYTSGLPPVADHWEEKLRVFATRCEALRARLIVVDDVAALSTALRTVVDEAGASQIGFQRHAIVEPAVRALGREAICVDDGFDAHALERCELGVTSCFALVAQTGSVMVTSRTSGGRALSVLPPHHVVLATAHDLIADLPSAYARWHAQPADERGSMLSLISGPSRTGDIERILVLGAHGPKQLTILLARS